MKRTSRFARRWSRNSRTNRRKSRRRSSRTSERTKRPSKPPSTALVKQIRTGTIEVKAAALRVLGKAGDAALGQIALITEQAKDPDSVVRAAAISALGSLGPGRGEAQRRAHRQCAARRIRPRARRSAASAPRRRRRAAQFPLQSARRLSQGLARRARHAREGAAYHRADPRHG